MQKKILPALTLVALLTSCTALKPLAPTNSRQAYTSGKDSQQQVRFLDISTDDNDSKGATSTIKEERLSKPVSKISSDAVTVSPNNPGSTKLSSIQLKYSQLLNTDAEQIQNVPLYQTIDDWYGTKYKLGGTSKTGIDCSAFVQTIFGSVFGIVLPRTAKDQYKATRRISRTKLQEGDLLFFNTLGGVSHVGIYLQNNKFVHASVSGVMISDMFEPYYVKHFIAAGRVQAMNGNSGITINP